MDFLKQNVFFKAKCISVKLFAVDIPVMRCDEFQLTNGEVSRC
jgi:hypothetical protein